MVIQYIAAAVILFGMAMFTCWLQVIGWRETKRRSSLPLEEQERLNHDDAVWSQRFGF